MKIVWINILKNCNLFHRNNIGEVYIINNNEKSTTSFITSSIHNSTNFAIDDWKCFMLSRFVSMYSTYFDCSETHFMFFFSGSNLPGCKPSLTTPSFCFPGSKDKRCPQLPDTFSTRMPSTYLPPFPDSNANRVKRSTLVENPNHEIIKFSLSFKSFSFSPEE